MSFLPDSTGTTSKWDILKAQLVASLETVKDRLSLGLQLFPYSDLVADPATGLLCQMPESPTLEVAVAPGTQSLGTIATWLNATSPAGNTPTAHALGQALQYFETGAGASLVGDRYVLLATDGGPNCSPDPNLTCSVANCIPNREGLTCPGEPDQSCCVPQPAQCLDDQATIAAIRTLADAGIHTFVVGMPGSELYSQTLDLFAEAGGEAIGSSTSVLPRYYQVESAGNMRGLADVLSRITTQLLTSCRTQLETQPPDPSRLNVYIDGALVPQQGPQGWVLDQSTDPFTIELLGNTCLFMQNNGAQRVDIQYGCPTIQ
jgi:hypothetical protein